VTEQPARRLPAGDPFARELPLDALRYAELPDARRELLLRVSDLLDGVAYGTVVLVLHEGKVVQVETSEKIRLG
jgi:hypothetical protein